MKPLIFVSAARGREESLKRLLDQLAAGLQPVLDDGVRQRLDDGVGAGQGFHGLP